MLRKLERAARALKTETLVVYVAIRDPRTPWLARLVAGCVVAYALSPLDLVPDFVPILGYLDDLILVPLGLALALKLIPPEVLTDARERARELAARPTSRAAGLTIVLIWLASAALVLWLAIRALSPPT